MEVRLRLYFDQFGQIPLVFPPVNEQDKIVDFLDHKTQQIDKLIATETAKNRTPQRIPSIPHRRSGDRQDRCPKRGIDHADISRRRF